MPRVETYGAPRVTARPLSPPRRQAHETPESEGAERQAAIARFGAIGAQLGAELLDQVLERERARADQVFELTMEQQFNDLDEQLLTAPDVGLLHKTGLEPMERRNEYVERFDLQAGEIGKAAKGEAQRLAFERAKAQRRMRLEERIGAHAVAQLDLYEASEAKAAIASAMNAAIATAEPQRIADAIALVKTTVERHGARLGLVGPEARETFIDDSVSAIHEGVLVTLLAQRKDRAAKAYLEEVEDQITGPARARIQEKVASASSALMGLRAAEEIWNAHAPKDDEDAIEIDAMETEARRRFADDPDTLAATITQLRTRKQGVDAGRKERDDERLSTVWEMALRGASYAEVAATPAFINAPGRVQVTVRDYYTRQAEHQASLAYQAESRAAARESRAYTAALRREKELEMQGRARYYELTVDPAKFAAMSRGEILAELPRVGRANVDEMLREHEQLNRSAANVRNATIDAELFNELAGPALGDFVFKTPGQQREEEKAQLGLLRSRVLDAIAREQGATGRELDRERKRQLMTEIIDRKVMVDEWGRDSQYVAAVVRPEDVPNAYIPIDQVPAYALTEYVDWLKRNNRSAATQTPEHIRRTYRAWIEKAWARAVLGRPLDEVLNALRGQ